MEIKLSYGKTSITFNLSGDCIVDWILPREELRNPEPLKAIQQALRILNRFLLKGQINQRTVAIAISDKTRPVPYHLLLPSLLDLLQNAGRAKSDIHLIVASGTHQPMKAGELYEILPRQVISDYPVSIHDCDNSPMISLGTTSRGTPVSVNQDFYHAELKITIGNIEPHHFMGYTGGAKTAAIGLTSRQTINKNHSMITHPNAITGHFDDNPMRQDVEEIGKMIGIHFSIDTILTTQQEIIHVIAGDPPSVMVAGIPLSCAINQVDVKDKYDLVVVSPGGYPKDINFYQAQKALTHAGLITKIGGDILLLAECSEGIGRSAYEKLMQSVTSHSEVMKYFNSHAFVVGPHKAYLVARDGLTKNIHLHSSMSDSTVRRLLLSPVAEPQQFIKEYLSTATSACRIAILPYGSTTIPHIIS